MSIEPCSDSPCYSVMDYYHYKSLQFALVSRYNDDDNDDEHRDDVSNDSEITLVQTPSMNGHDNEKKVPQDTPISTTSTLFFSATGHLKTRLKQALAYQQHPKKEASISLFKKRWFDGLLLHRNRSDRECQTMMMMKKKKIRYQKKVTVHDTYSPFEYNREPDPMAACLTLTPDTAGEIKRELNLFKSNEMEVHPDSQMYTHYLV
ncbi:hypothetical protein BX666DRAFT_1879079 [Dichotomocladium elegans]|nr:hypothetical protein BX666DRAFT_1879079 [Dichotomocladium elegans]